MSRRGYSLTELLVVMSMTSVVFTVGVGMVHRVLHQQKFAGRDNAMHRVAERLATKLREDVHRATAAELIESDDQGERSLELNLPGQRIVTYTVRDNLLERVSTGVNVASHRDAFQFPDNYRLQFADRPSERVAFTAFAIPQDYLEPASDESRPDGIERNVRRAVMHVEAAVGRDHRFLNDKENR